VSVLLVIFPTKVVNCNVLKSLNNNAIQAHYIVQIWLECVRVIGTKYPG